MRPYIIALVPARAGSKRLPRKNQLPLGPLPLIGWTLKAAVDSGCFRHVYVSTEDENIATIARSFAGEVPWLRPPELAADHVRTAEVCVEFLKRLLQDDPQISGVMLLQPTSPFRSVKSIQSAIQCHIAHKGDSVISVSPATKHPYWSKKIDDKGIVRPFIEQASASRSQDLPSAYYVNGAIFLTSTETLLKTGGFYSARTRALVMDDPVESLDIDTPHDLRVAELFASEILADDSGGRA